MPKLVFTILSIFAFFLISSQQLTVGSQCRGKNAFLKRLSRYNVTIFDVAKIPSNSTKCGSEWASYGSCCEYSSLLQYAAGDRKEIQHSVKKIKQRAQLAAASLQKFFAYLKSPGRVGPKYEIGRILKTLESSISTKHAPFVNSLADPVQFNSSIDRCWEKMAILRSKSLCPTCSGRSQLFFADSKALVMPALCRAILEVCHLPFEQLLKFAQLSGELYTLAAKLNKGKFTEDQKINGNLERSAKIHTAIQQTRFVKQLKNFVWGSQNTTVEHQLCATILKLSNRSLAAELSVLYWNIKYEILVITQLLTKQHESAKSKEAKAKKHVPPSKKNWDSQKKHRVRLLKQEDQKGEAVTISFADPGEPVSEFLADEFQGSLEDKIAATVEGFISTEVSVFEQVSEQVPDSKTHPTFDSSDIVPSHGLNCTVSAEQLHCAFNLDV